MARLFHATALENVPSIQREGILPKFGEVYLTDSIDSACKWIAFRLVGRSQIMAVIEVEVDETKLIEGTDHSPLMVQLFGVGKSLVSDKKIAKSRIKKIHYFKIGGQNDTRN
jgi:hypothetical protein